MVAQKVVVLNTEHEIEMLKSKVNILESVIEYSVAETVQGLKKQVKDLETEAIQ